MQIKFQNKIPGKSILCFNQIICVNRSVVSIIAWKSLNELCISKLNKNRRKVIDSFTIRTRPVGKKINYKHARVLLSKNFF